MQAAIEGAALVIHAAGPFQRKGSCTVLEACIDLKVPYVDVCDDHEYTEATKALHKKAADAGVPCITSAGIYPGMSCSLSKHLMQVTAICQGRRGCWAFGKLSTAIRATLQNSHCLHVALAVPTHAWKY